MGAKKPFALRIDAEVMEAVEKWAADEFRSTNGQLEWMINKCLKDDGRKLAIKFKFLSLRSPIF